jgi:hypothetical protein
VKVIEGPLDALTFGLEVAFVRRHDTLIPTILQVCAAVSLLLLDDVIALACGLVNADYKLGVLMIIQIIQITFYSEVYGFLE